MIQEGRATRLPQGRLERARARWNVCLENVRTVEARARSVRLPIETAPGRWPKSVLFIFDEKLE